MTRAVVFAAVAAAAIGCSGGERFAKRADFQDDANRAATTFIGDPSKLPDIGYIGSTGFTVDSTLYATFWVSSLRTDQIWLATTSGKVDNDSTKWTVIASMIPPDVNGDARVWQAWCTRDGVSDGRLVTVLHWIDGPVEDRIIHAWLADPIARRFIEIPVTGIQCRSKDPREQDQADYAVATLVVKPIVSVRIATYAARSDTIELSYVVQNSPNNSGPVMTFGLVTEARVVRTSAGADAHGWVGVRRSGSARSSPAWAAAGDGLQGGGLQPGETSTPLTIAAIGMTDVVTYLAAPGLMLIPEIQDDKSMDRMRRIAGIGRTIGVVPRPADLTTAAQARRLGTLLDYACGEGALITRGSTCDALRSKLSLSAATIATGDTARARRDVGSFISALEAGVGDDPGKPISMTAYALLRPNASLLLRR